MRTYHSGGGTSKLAVAAIAGALILAASGAGGVAASSGGSSYSTASMQSLEALWEQAGGSASAARNAACHAEQESSGNPVATSANPDGGENIGVFQLDTRGVGSGYSVGQLEDPLTNAKITVDATDDGANWSDWATPGCA